MLRAVAPSVFLRSIPPLLAAVLAVSVLAGCTQQTSTTTSKTTTTIDTPTAVGTPVATPIPADPGTGDLKVQSSAAVSSAVNPEAQETTAASESTAPEGDATETTIAAATPAAPPKTTDEPKEDLTSGGRYEFRRDHDPNGTGKFYMGREIAYVMGFAGAPWLERPEREREEATSKMIEALELKPGMTIADIGAGSGVISLLMAEKVLPGGRVIAVDVQQEMLDLLQAKLKLKGVENVDLLLSSEKSPRLDPESVDLAIMVDVYHELSFPYEMMLELSKAMKVGGRIAFVEFRLEDPDVPIKLVHKMSQAQVKREINAPELNLRYVQTIDVLPWQHVIVFQKVGADGGFVTLSDTQVETTKLTTPDEALKSLRLPEGFQATLFAHEPDIRQPIALTTDERGRLWVAENYSYAESAINFAGDQYDRIVILEDTDGDGRHDKRTIFHDRVKKLTSVEVGFGGVWALCAPNLIFIPDRDGDDIPDSEPVIALDGFDDGAVRHNIVNGLRWGPDGWLYGRHGILATSVVGPPGASESQRTRLNCSIWRYHPLRHDFEVVAHGTTNSWGHDFDEHGELFFINTVIGHLWHVIPGAHFRRMYGSDFNPRTYQLIEQTADHFHWDTREVWSDIRKGVTDTTSAAGGGHAHSGLMLYLGDNWPADYRNNVFAINLHGRRLNRDLLEREHAGYVAHHGEDCFYFGDPWFRGIDLIYGPDGGVFVADWSDIGECHDNDGIHRGSGRIYKITHGQPQAVKGLNLGAMTSDQLAQLQLHKNDWYVRQSRRLLHERAYLGLDLSDAHERLTGILADHNDVTRRLRALWALHSTGYLTEDFLIELLDDSDEHIQAWAVRLLVDAGTPSDEAVTALAKLATQSTAGLPLLHLAGALQKVPVSRRPEIAAHLARKENFAGDRALPLLVWYGLEPATPQDLGSHRDALFFETRLPHLRRFLARRLTEEIERRPDDVVFLVALLAPAGGDGTTGPSLAEPAQLEVLTGMTEALRGWRKAPRPSNWDGMAAHLATSGNTRIVELTRELSVLFGDGRAVDELRAIATNGMADPEARRQALRALTESRAEGLAALCHQVLTDRSVDGEAIRALAVADHPENAARILSVYPRLDPETRQLAIATLTSRVASAVTLLDAVAKGQVRRQDVSAYYARQIRSLGNEALSKKLNEVWGETRESADDKKAIAAKFKEQLSAERLATANLSAGRALFNKTCAACHVMYGQGKSAGPDLTGGNRKNLDYLLENLVDPNASVAADFRMSVLALKDGRVLNGVVVEKLEKALGVQTQTERVYVAREDIDEIKPTESSLMPEGLLSTLTPEQLIDLVGYLQSTQQAPLPEGAAP